jgi:hypothetical protein
MVCAIPEGLIRKPSLHGSAFISHFFIWPHHLFLSNRTQNKHDRTKYLSPSWPLRMVKYLSPSWPLRMEKVLLLFEAEAFAKLLITKITVHISQVISMVNLILTWATKCKLSLNSFPGCQDSYHCCNLYRPCLPNPSADWMREPVATCCGLNYDLPQTPTPILIYRNPPHPVWWFLEWGLWEVMRLTCVNEGRVLMMRSMPW